MKTFVFHSYKGGSGRTLALANFALFLRSKNKKVLMIDFDFEAPGLAYKFNKHNDLKGGYLDYLMGTSPSERALKLNRPIRMELLRDYLIDVPDENLRLLPAGDPGRLLYWKHLASIEFHRLFSFAQHDDGLTGTKSSSLAEHESWKAFKQDLQDIKEAAGKPDFCLIDCKAAQEPVSVPLLAWADHIIEFLHCNREGVFGTLLVLRMLKKNELRSPHFAVTPVIARVPYGGRSGDIDSMTGDTTSIRQRIQTEIASIMGTFGGSFVSEVKFPEEIQVLVEQKEIEIGDILLLNKSDSSEYPLSYNYVELFDSLAGLASQKEKNESLIALKLNQEDEILERIFRFSFRRGELLNKDGERNIALRKKTIVELMNSLATDQNLTLEKKGLSNRKKRIQDIQAAFENAGYRAGESFGLEAISVPEVWVNRKMPTTPLERLRQWCIFDRNAGFGDWTAEYRQEDKEGAVYIKNHFLEGTQDDVGWYFMRGYVRGVLGHLVGDVGTLARIKITRTSATKIEFRYEGAMKPV